MRQLMKKISIPEEAMDEICALYEKIKSDTTLYDSTVCRYYSQLVNARFSEYKISIGIIKSVL